MVTVGIETLNFHNFKVKGPSGFEGDQFGYPEHHGPTILNNCDRKRLQ